MIHIPVGYSQTLKDPKVNWLYATEPDAGTGRCGCTCPGPGAGVLGGSSSINGLLYIRRPARRLRRLAPAGLRSNA